MKKDTENKLLNKNTKPTSMRILVYDFLAAQKVLFQLSEIEEQLLCRTELPPIEP